MCLLHCLHARTVNAGGGVILDAQVNVLGDAEACVHPQCTGESN